MNSNYGMDAETKCFMDIETIPNEEELRIKISEMVKLEKEDGKIGDDKPLDEIVNERFRRLALSGEQGRILCIGVIFEKKGCQPVWKLIGWSDEHKCFHEDEAVILSEFWSLCGNLNPRRDLIIGHNIFDFDLLFIHKRSIINRIKPTVNFSFARYRSQPIYDTMREWEKWRWERISLENLAEALNIPSPKNADMDGSKVYDHFMAGNHNELADYCYRDVITTREIFNRMNFLKTNREVIK